MGRTQWTEKRTQYLNHEISFDEFYGWVAEQSGIAWHGDEFMGHTLEWWADKYAQDEHLNNVPLKHFDNMMPQYQSLAGRAGMWVSLGDCVCTYKAVIRNKIKAAA